MLFRRNHQPWEIRLFHWLFAAVIFIKLWSGLYVSFLHPFWGFPDLYRARMTHALMTPVLAALLVFRLYLAVVFGDWRRLILWRRADLKQLRPWLRYHLFLENNKPVEIEKYNVIQRFLFTSIFITMPLFYATGVIMLNLPFMRWINVFFGGQGISRIIHYLLSVFLAAFIAVHIYLTLTSSVDRLKAMFSGRIHVRKPAGESGEEKL